MRTNIITFIFIVLLSPAVFSQNYPLVTPVINPASEAENRTRILADVTLSTFWQSSLQPGAPVSIGQRIILTLNSSWNNQQPPASFFMPEVPQGLILSMQPITEEDRENGILIKLLLIPLSAGEIILPSRTLTHRGTVQSNTLFAVPAFSLRVN
ncbi:MAG: hypothetical protein FWD28_08470 [Treponema sp.]|nr:hypothetical protein [Treponema sp.]